MNNYCNNLTLSINPLIDGVSVNDILPTDYITRWIFVNDELINPEFKALLKSLGLGITKVSLFTLIDHQSFPIHIGSDNLSDITKIKWVYSSNNTDPHDVIWYEFKPETNPVLDPLVRDPFNNSIHDKYVLCDMSEVQEVYRASIGAPSLVQVGVPRSVHNYAGVWKCLSAGLCIDGDPTSTIPMWQAQQIFAQYL